MRVPGAEREAPAIVRTLKEGVPARDPIDQDVLGSVEQRFGLARGVRLQAFVFFRLRPFDGLLTRRRLWLLRDGRRRGSSYEGDYCEQPPHSNPTHGQLSLRCRDGSPK